MGADGSNVCREALDTGSVLPGEERRRCSRELVAGAEGKTQTGSPQRHRNGTGDSGHKWRERTIPTGYKEAAFHSEQG